MSSTFTPAETLRQHRPLLLAMEAIGWFHMAGKARAEFLRWHGGDKVDYSYDKWHRQENPPFPWNDLLEWTKRLYGSSIPAGAWQGSFAEFTEKHRDRTPSPGLLGLLQAGHGVVSGVEKNLPGSTSSKYLNQSLLHMWLSSPWGHPKRNLLAEPPEILTPQGWQQLVGEIRRVLEEARDLGTQGVQDVGLWKRWREGAIGEGSFIRRAFLSTLAETRLPNNDVTLWDQSYVAAALFKSAVAGALLNQNHPWTDSRIKGKVRWRLLTVAIGTEHYKARSVKIGDWTGAWGAIREFFDRVAELVEVDLGIGSLLYQDDSVSAFSFPGERFDETVPASWVEDWKDWLSEQVDRIAQDLDLETPPTVRLSAPTRSLVPIIKEREEALKVVAIPIHKQWDVRWSVPSEARGHVCPACHIRLNGDPTSKTKPCQTCRDRRSHRRNDWLQGHLGYDTIWFEEVADHNDRIALLTLSLDLEPWLNGDRVDSLRAQAISEWFGYNRKVSKSIENQTSHWRSLPLHERLTQYFKKRINKPQQQISTDGILRSLIPNLEEEFSDSGGASESWQRVYNRLVEDRAKAPAWSNDSEQNARWFVFQSFRKLPSPGRVYRFWREAEEFFQDLLREFRQIASRSTNPWRVRRLVLIPKNNNQWNDLTLYNSHWRGQPLSLLYVESLGGFITVSNLARMLQPEESGQAFQNERISLEQEEQPGWVQDMEVKDVKELGRPHPHLGMYAPIIPVSLTPLRFRVLVPLEAASECVDLVLKWWKERFARVWDRLPIWVGVVAFPRTLPYQAVVEATRNLEEALAKEKETWQVEEVERQAGVTALRLRRKDGQSTLRVVPISLPDGREDVFYPYVVVEDRELRFPHDFRHPEDGRIYRHIADLHPGDGIQVHPTRVVTLFMDSTAARFTDQKVCYLEEWEQIRETWELLRRVAPSQTALQRLRSALGYQEEAWHTPEGACAVSDDLRRDTYRAFLASHLECRGTALETLTTAAMHHLLQRTLDWHITVLKEKP